MQFDVFSVSALLPTPATVDRPCGPDAYISYGTAGIALSTIEFAKGITPLVHFTPCGHWDGTYF
jgi:hypothetical protein